MAGTRLRKTFRYPAEEDDDDDDEIPNDLDEEGYYIQLRSYIADFVLMLAPRARETHREAQSRER